MKTCVICAKELAILGSRTISDGHSVCEDCFSKARTLSPMQILRTKKLTPEQIRASIVQSGFEVKEYEPPTVEELEEQLNPKIKCPECNSLDIQFMQNNKKSFSVGKAIGGGILTGGVGTLAGFVGKKGDDQWRCNDCGNIFTSKKN